jgi:hypothetical protein
MQRLAEIATIICGAPLVTCGAPVGYLRRARRLKREEFIMPAAANPPAAKMDAAELNIEGGRSCGSGPA